MMDYSFTRYLSAKKSVDDRALNRGVLDTLIKSLPPSTSTHPLQVLEVGAGIGTMLERLLEWHVFQHVSYLGIDSEPENIAHAQQRLPSWAAGQNFQISLPEARQGGRIEAAPIRLSRPGQSVSAQFIHQDLFDLLKDPAHQQVYDVLIAHAFLDLIDLPSALPRVLRLLKPGGLFYFTLNFDGETIFEPASDQALDAEIMGAYHRSMDERGTGHSRTGRRMFTELARAGGRILNAGSSDWVVFPVNGVYPFDEAYFLHHILSFVSDSLTSRIPPERLQPWLAFRHAQVEQAELVYLAHQLDFTGIREIG